MDSRELEKKSKVAALPAVEAEDEENKDAAELDSVKGGKDAVGKSGQSVGRAFGQRFFSSSQAPEMKKKRKRHCAKIKIRRRRTRARENPAKNLNALPRRSRRFWHSPGLPQTAMKGPRLGV